MVLDMSTLLSLMIALLLALLPFAAAAAPCSLCKDGGPFLFPDKKVIIPGTDASAPVACSQLEVIFLFVLPDEDSEECKLGQRFTTICGCARPEDSCDLCPDGSPVGNPSELVPEFVDILQAVPDCAATEAYLQSFSSEHELCVYGQRNVAQKCGCPTQLEGDFPDIMPNITGVNDVEFNNLFRSVFGAEDRDQVVRMKRIVRGSGSLSLLGGLAVVLDNMMNGRREKRRNVYNSVVTLMAVCDILTGIMWIIGDIATPAQDFFLSTTDKGNNATCIAQGFFLHLGTMTSLFLNVSLATFYVMVLTSGWPRQRIAKLRPVFLLVPTVFGICISCGTVPFISPGPLICSMTSPNSLVLESLLGYEITWTAFLCLVLVPVYVVIVYATIAMAYGYFYVRKIEAKAAKWKFPNTSSFNSQGKGPLSSTQSRSRASVDGRREKKSKLRKDVVRQSILYLISLHLCWLIYAILSSLSERLLTGYYELWTFMFFFLPLQGFLNAIVYFRPRFGVYMTDTLAAVRSRLPSRQHAQVIQPSESTSSAKKPFLEPSLILMDMNNDAISALSTDANLAVGPVAAVADIDEKCTDDDEENGNPLHTQAPTATEDGTDVPADQLGDSQDRNLGSRTVRTEAPTGMEPDGAHAPTGQSDSSLGFRPATLPGVSTAES